MSGSIDLFLPADVAADFDVSTFSGSIRNDFGPAARRTSEYIPGKELSFTSGKGGARVVAKSFSGAVNLRKR
jgi:predicted membrane protein